MKRIAEMLVVNMWHWWMDHVHSPLFVRSMWGPMRKVPGGHTHRFDPDLPLVRAYCFVACVLLRCEERFCWWLDEKAHSTSYYYEGERYPTE